MTSYPQRSKSFLVCIRFVCMFFLLWIPGCANGIHTQNDAEEKPSPGVTIPGSNKVSPSLRAIIDQMVARGITRQNARELGASDLSNRLVRVNEEGGIQTYIHVHTFGAEERALLESHEEIIEIANEELRIIQAWIPFDRIYEVAELAFVKRITPPSYGIPRTGSVTSEGDAILNADELRALKGFDGSGVKVGVISNGVDNRASAQATGDLPSNITIQTYPGSGDEGTAILEIIHDLAPRAELGFCGPDTTTSLEMIECVNDLAGIFGADIIVDDLGFWEEPYFEDGPVAQAVANALASGVVYTSATGNDADSHYQGLYVDSGDGMGSHQISPGNNVFEVHWLWPYGVCVYVQWSNPFGLSGDNYDHCGSGETPAECAQFNDVQDGDDDPLEYYCFSPCPFGDSCSWEAQVRLVSGSEQILEVFVLGGELNAADQVAEDSVFGHPAVLGILAAGAIDANDPGNDDIQPYSSRGPSTILYPASESRQKPDITAIDGASVIGAGGFPSPFYGTSASAPHVAGVAALLKGGYTTADEIIDAIKNSAVDLGPLGTDNTFGAGRIDALAAASELPNVPSGLSATPLSFNETDLTWSDNSTNESGFRIERKIGSGVTYSEVATVGAGVASFNDTGVNEDTTYYYRVRAYNSTGYSGYTNEANATTNACAPSDLSATAATSSQINLSWTDNCSGETGFSIEQKTGSEGAYSEVATLGADVTSFNDTGLNEATTFYYRVCAYNSTGYSGYSNEANATTLSPSIDGDGDGGGGCFIATAAFGSLMKPHVKVLREFRDRFLLTNAVGKTFVDLYYTYSPPLAGLHC